MKDSEFSFDDCNAADELICEISRLMGRAIRRWPPTNPDILEEMNPLQWLIASTKVGPPDDFDDETLPNIEKQCGIRAGRGQKYSKETIQRARENGDQTVQSLFEQGDTWSAVSHFLLAEAMAISGSHVGDKVMELSYHAAGALGARGNSNAADLVGTEHAEAPLEEWKAEFREEMKAANDIFRELKSTAARMPDDVRGEFLEYIVIPCQAMILLSEFQEDLAFEEAGQLAMVRARHMSGPKI